jgi:predicted TIM-barrel fold metal-dependent hydrolase
MFAHSGVRLIKVHPESNGYPIDGPAYEPVWSFAEARRIPVLTHTWGKGHGYDHAYPAEHVARAHPAMPVV